MLKSGETDIALFLDGPEAEAATKDPRMQLVATRHASIFWIEFADQWDPKSPWSDRRLRLAVNLRARPQGDQRGGLPRLLPARRGHRAARDGLRAAGRAARLRPARGPSSSWRRPAIPTGIDAGEFVRHPGLRHRGRGRAEQPERGRASGCGCARWSARPSTRPGRRRSCAGSSSPRWATPAMRPAGWSRSSTPRAATPTAAIRTSTSCSCSRPASGIRPSARRCSTASSSSPSTG